MANDLKIGGAVYDIDAPQETGEYLGLTENGRARVRIGAVIHYKPLDRVKVARGVRPARPRNITRYMPTDSELRQLAVSNGITIEEAREAILCH